MSKSEIALLKKQIKKLDAPDFDLEAWKISTQLLLTDLFGKFDPKTLTIRDLKIDYSSTMLRDSTADYKPVETCKKKGREILELAIDQLELAPSWPDGKLAKYVAAGDRSAMIDYLNKQKKDTLVEWLAKMLKS